MSAEHSQEQAVVTQDLEELEFSPLTPDEAVALEDRVYLLGVHADRHRVLAPQ